MTIAPVSPRNLHDVWVDLWPLLEPAARLAPGEPRVLSRILDGSAQLWAVRENGKPVAAVVTGLMFSPQKRCLVWMVGGSRIAEWLGEFLAKLEGWARSLGCVALYAETPRKGWARIARNAGFQLGEPLDGFMTWERRL